MMSEQARLERDAALWREHVQYLKDVNLPGSLHIRMSVGIGEQMLSIEKVLPMREIESAIRGVDVVNFVAADMFKQLVAGRWIGNL